MFVVVAEKVDIILEIGGEMPEIGIHLDSGIFYDCDMEAVLTTGQRRAFRHALKAGKLESARRILIDAGVAENPMDELIPIILERKAKLVTELLGGEPTGFSGLIDKACTPDSLTNRLLPKSLKEAWRRGDPRAILKAVRSHGLYHEMHAVVQALLVGDVLDEFYVPIYDRTVLLLSLTFDHSVSPDPSSSLHLRRDISRSVCRPEWRAGQNEAGSSPVLYATSLHGSQVPILKAKIKPAVSSFTGQVEIRASGGGMLGKIDPFIVEITGPNPIIVDVPLPHHTFPEDHPPSGGRGMGLEDVSWVWEHRTSGKPWRYLATSHHRVYLVPQLPQEPWDVTNYGLLNNPWTYALDVACHTFPESLDDPIDGIAVGVCELLNPGGAAPNPFGIKYDIDGSGNQHYAGSHYLLQEMLLRTLGAYGNGPIVNCDDCAGLVVSLANLLGCDLYEQTLITSAINPVMPIGFGNWFLPGLGFVDASGMVGTFALSYHTFAWRGQGIEDGKVFDITYQLNSFPSASNSELPNPLVRIALGQYSVRFSQPGRLDYIEMLHASPTFGWQLGNRQRRKIA